MHARYARAICTHIALPLCARAHWLLHSYPASCIRPSTLSFHERVLLKMDCAQTTDLKFKDIELHDVAVTYIVLGRGSYGVVTEVNVKGLRYDIFIDIQ